MAKEEKLGKYVEQYEGRDGGQVFTVKVLRIGEKVNEEALIQVIGVDDELDGKVYKYKKEWQNSDRSLHKFIYVTDEIPEQGRYGLFHSNSNWGNQTITIYLYDDREVPIDIWPKENPPNLDPNFMYDKYLKSKK